MCADTSVPPASGPASAMIFPRNPAKWTSIAALLSLSHSSPRPPSGAGWLSTPVEVWPNRSIVQWPSGTSQESRPFLIFAVRSRIRLRSTSLSFGTDRKSTRLNSSHRCISYAVFCLKKQEDAGFGAEAEKKPDKKGKKKYEDDDESPTSTLPVLADFFFMDRATPEFSTFSQPASLPI